MALEEEGHAFGHWEGTEQQ